MPAPKIIATAKPKPQKRVVLKKLAKTKFQDFLPLRKLGKGSFGDVYLVKHLVSGTLFAMKTLAKRNTSEGTNWLRYVRTERDVLVGSKSPFINKLNYAF